MSFFQLIRREMQGSLPWLLAMAAVGDVSNAAISAAINSGAQTTAGNNANLWSASLFLISLILFAEFIGTIAKETTTLSQAFSMLAFAAQGVVLVLFVALYIAYSSPLAFALSVIIVGVAAVLFHIKHNDVAQGLRKAAEWASRLYERLIDLLVVAHDERYLDEFKLPARRLRMDEGLFVEQHSVENNG